MGNGQIAPGVVEDLAESVEAIQGDFAEVGVLKGATFKRLVPIATTQNKLAHAFDSFLGMAEPTDRDLSDYPKGKMSIGGENVFRHIMDNNEFKPSQYRVWSGCIPDCLYTSDITKLSFIYVDLDHYQPTADVIIWMIPLLSKGAIVGFDDYFPKRNLGPSPLIDKFMAESDLETLYHKNNQIFFRW